MPVILAVCAAFASAAFAAPPVVPTEALKLKVGEDSTVTVKVEDGKKGAYGEGFRPVDCLFFRGYSPDESTMTFLVRPKRPGFFRVVFWTVGEGAPAFLDIDATGSAPPVVVDPDDPDTPPPVDPTTKASQVTYVYEKDATAVPGFMVPALNTLNREKKLLATLLDVDVKDGTGDVPEQYRIPFAAAREAGLPALVVTGDGKVLRVVRDPKTEDDVLKAVP